MTDENRRKITNPHLLARQEKTLKSIQATIDEINAWRKEDGQPLIGESNREDGGIPMDERIAMAREMAGDLAQDVEVGEDGSITVTLAPRH